MTKYILIEGKRVSKLFKKPYFNECIPTLNRDGNAAFFVPEDLLIIDDLNKELSKENNFYSRVIKFFLATNYFYSILDEIKETEYYRQGVKASVNKLLDELDKLQKHPDIKKFYEIANPEIHLNNLDLHSMFFEKLPLISSELLEQFMIEFLTKYNIKDEK